jgi:multiple sugar transport system substrate-binding protein/putative spermidine/putrescine transport system substrate-binding protein
MQNPSRLAVLLSSSAGLRLASIGVEGEAATQQLIPARQAGVEAPANLFFGPNGNMRALTQAGVIANIGPLIDLLPNAAGLDSEAARRSRGFEHGSTGLSFHPNQTVLAYDSAKVDQVPQTLSNASPHAHSCPFVRRHRAYARLCDNRGAIG